MGPKTYKHDDKRLMQMKAYMIETDHVNGERKFNLALDEVRNLDNKALSKMDLFYMKKNKKGEKWNLNVYEYLTYVFDTLPTINKNEEDDLRKLLPYSKDLTIKLKVTK